MKCYSCGSTIPEDSEFCPFCGADLYAQEKTTQKPGNRTQSLLIILVIILGILVFGLVAYLFVFRNHNEPENIAEAHPDTVATEAIQTIEKTADEPGEETVEERIAGALEILENGGYVGLDVLNDLALQGSEQAKEAYEIHVERLYNEAVDYYHNNAIYKARAIFLHTAGYKETDKYLALITPTDYKELLDIIDFENAKEIIIEKFADSYLEGLWTSEDGVYSFQLIKASDGKFDVTYNLPAPSANSSKYRISDGILYTLPESITSIQEYAAQFNEASGNNSSIQRTDLFRFIAQTTDRVQVYCYYGGTVIEMKRIG